MSMRSPTWTTASPAAPPGHLAKARAPDRHLPTAVGRDDRSSIDRGGDFGDGE